MSRPRVQVPSPAPPRPHRATPQQKVPERRCAPSVQARRSPRARAHRGLQARGVRLVRCARLRRVWPASGCSARSTVSSTRRKSRSRTGMGRVGGPRTRRVATRRRERGRLVVPGCRRVGPRRHTGCPHALADGGSFELDGPAATPEPVTDGPSRSGAPPSRRRSRAAGTSSSASSARAARSGCTSRTTRCWTATSRSR